MPNNRKSQRFARKKNTFIPRLIVFLVILLVLSAASIITYSIVSRRIHGSDTVTALYDYWEKYDYAQVYQISSRMIQTDPMHNTARTFHGYSSFYLAVSETDNTKSQALLDEAINNLRIAMQNAKEDTLPQIYYMLGKSYFYKNNASSYHYYADLVVKYLELAQELGYRADDMAELLGLSYAHLGATQNSIAAFSEALLVRESDTLLLDIAKQYCGNGQGAVAKQYLFQVLSMTKNDDIYIKARELLGQIYTEEENYDDAQKEFEAILEKNANSADAHYGLGILYEKKGDMAKARAEWRTCLKIQVNHPGALKKMSETK